MDDEKGGDAPTPEDFRLKKLPVTKLDAARRQIGTAICLWFDEGDPVSIHTLIAAAHGILRDINKKLVGQPMLSEPSPFIRPGKENEVRRVMRAAANFFKHADTDAKETIFFSTRANDFFILESCEVYSRLAKERRPLMRLFTQYFLLHEPNMFLPDPTRELIPVVAIDEARRLSKQQYFALGLPLMSRISVP